MSLLQGCKIFLLSLFLAFSAIANESDQTLTEETPYTRCENPRPEVCNQSYQPICADRDTGVRCIKAPCPQAREKVTYSNNCMACTDKKVYGYWNGACADSIDNNNNL